MISTAGCSGAATGNGAGTCSGTGSGRGVGAGAVAGVAARLTALLPNAAIHTAGSRMRSIEIAPASQAPAAWPLAFAAATSARAPSASSDGLSPISLRAAGVASIRAPSSPNTATGSTQAASSRGTRCASRKIGPAAVERGDQHRRRAVGEGEPRARAGQHPAHRGAESAQPFEPRGAIVPQRRRNARDFGGGGVRARRMCGSQARPVSVRRTSLRRSGSPRAPALHRATTARPATGLEPAASGAGRATSQSSPTVAPAKRTRHAASLTVSY